MTGNIWKVPTNMLRAKAMDNAVVALGGQSIDDLPTTRDSDTLTGVIIRQYRDLADELEQAGMTRAASEAMKIANILEGNNG